MTLLPSPGVNLWPRIPAQQRTFRSGLQSQDPATPQSRATPAMIKQSPSYGQGTPWNLQRQCLGPQVWYRPGWLQVAPTLFGASGGVPPPDRHPLVQACRPSPGKFRARLASVRGRQDPSFAAEASRLSLVEEGRESGLFHLVAAPAPACEAWGPGGNPWVALWGDRAQRGVQLSQYQRGGWGVWLGDLMLKFHVHRGPTVFCVLVFFYLFFGPAACGINIVP